MWAIAIGALAIAAGSGIGQAAVLDDSLYQRAEMALVEPWNPVQRADQRDIRVPHPGIDPGMTIQPPRVGARMPVVTPPGTLDQPYY
jgi:hypothetical protein